MKTQLLTTCVIALSALSSNYANNKPIPLAESISALHTQEYAFEYKSYTASRQSPLITAMLGSMDKADDSVGSTD